MIERKQTTRWYAPYMSTSGTMRKKGFGSRMAAARFLAKQALFDYVFGPKEVVFRQTVIDNGYCVYKRNVPSDKDERLAKWAEAFPLEECEQSGRLDECGERPSCYDCERHGYARCQSHNWLATKAREFYSEEVER